VKRPAFAGGAESKDRRAIDKRSSRRSPDIRELFEVAESETTLFKSLEAIRILLEHCSTQFHKMRSIEAGMANPWRSRGKATQQIDLMDG
jgi:hypothetical protein